MIPGREDIVIRDERARVLRSEIEMSKIDLQPVKGTYCGDLMQITLKGEAETVKVQVVEIIVEWVFTATVVNIGEDG